MLRGGKALLVLALLVAVAAGCSGGAGNETSTDTPTTGEGSRPTSGETTGEQMSLREAVGQMFMVGMNGTEPDYYINKMIRERNIGGVILFGANMESRAQTQELVGSLQRLSMETEPAVPLLVAVDQEGGEISHVPWVSAQPSAAQVGAAGSPRQARAIARRMGAQMRGAGINTNLAPVSDTGNGAAIGSRSFGSDPELVSRMVAASVEGYERAGIVSSAKHFPNHGPATIDSHTGSPRIDHDRETLYAYDLPPFEAAIDAGVPMVMVGHLTYPAIDPRRPASLSPEAIGILRQDLGFKGVVITDDLSMEGAKQGGSVQRASVRAVKAGADMLIISDVPSVQADSYRAVLNAVRSGEIPRRQVYESVERIERVKEKYPVYRGEGG